MLFLNFGTAFGVLYLSLEYVYVVNFTTGLYEKHRQQNHFGNRLKHWRDRGNFQGSGSPSEMGIPYQEPDGREKADRGTKETGSRWSGTAG